MKEMKKEIQFGQVSVCLHPRFYELDIEGYIVNIPKTYNAVAEDMINHFAEPLDRYNTYFEVPYQCYTDINYGTTYLGKGCAELIIERKSDGAIAFCGFMFVMGNGALACFGHIYDDINTFEEIIDRDKLISVTQTAFNTLAIGVAYKWNYNLLDEESLDEWFNSLIDTQITELGKYMVSDIELYDEHKDVLRQVCKLKWHILSLQQKKDINKKYNEIS